MIERIKKVISRKSKSTRDFAKIIGFNYSTLNNYVTGRRSAIDCELAEKIITSFDDIDAKWLLTGKGQMILEKTEESESLGHDDNFLLDRFEKLIRENERLTVENEQLQIELDKLGKKSNDALGA